ncbi:hypothetical protein SAY86_020502 [Trapa natans]|uniref:B box-type domain-containing protein n=1 Tax=Trapa natans TaxID=22666 RepID=A0AAN7R7S6_TRANT|nr:hypothetical protein SAY86_020502 [Trapa natans]
MKIRCDVCEKEKATVFCSADEAALCKDCDRRVHCANKLAGKHARYSLLHPNFKDSPLCDVCQERKALLFCQEDRAILCRECDIPIHRANELTQKHNRFLLTGVRLSPSSSSSSSAAAAAIHHQQPLASSPSTSGLWSQGSSSPPNHPEGLVNPTFEAGQGYGGSQEEENRAVVGGGCEGSMSTSSISEYLMETLPGWRVDEFLDSHQLGGHHHQHHHHHHHGYKNNNNSSISHGYCKVCSFKFFLSSVPRLSCEFMNAHPL